jgi:hypothetical protein
MIDALARISLETHEAQLKDLMLERPNQIVAKASGSTRLSASLPTINQWLADLGQSEVMAQLKVAGTQQYLTRTQAWMNQNLGSALPALLVGLNAWNVFSSANKAHNDGQFSADEWRTLGANAGYAANAIAALWVGPAWNRAGGMSADLGRKNFKLARAGYSEWLAEAKVASRGSTQASVASEMAAASKRLILRTVTWAALGAIAAGLEAWQLSNEIEHTTSEEENKLLRAKRGVVIGMYAVAGMQAIGSWLGSWFAFSWVMSTPVVILVAFLGVAYLMISMAANRYKREGLRLWLYQCSWGRGAAPKWLGDEGHPKQMQALLETLQRPSVLGRALYSGGGSTPRKWKGFWIQIQVPASLAGKNVTFQPAIVEKKNLFSDGTLIGIKHSFYEQFLNGNWIDPMLLGQLPNHPGGKPSPSDFAYAHAEQHRLWQVWIETSIDSPSLEVEINYPSGVLQRADARGYLFRLALEWSESEADRANNAFSGELKEGGNIELRQKSTQLLRLTIPTDSACEF